MAYSHSLHWNGASGRKSQEDGVEYDAVYRVITDDANDQAQKVIEWFENNVVAIGTAYEYADDADAGAVAKSITPNREKGSSTVWVVTVHYAPPGAGEFKFELTTEELEFRCEDVTVTTIQHQRPVERAEYKGGFVGKAAEKVAPGTMTAVMNSAFVPFNPGLEKDVAGLAVRTVHRLPFVNIGTVSSIMNRVNSEAFVFSHCGLTLNVLRYQARIVSGGVALRSEDGVKYWELALTMEILDEGWIDNVIDRGVHARAIDGDPSGRGTVISSNDVEYSIPGVPRGRELVDVDETPIADPVLFNGDGQPLDISSTVTPVLLTYLKYSAIDFKGVVPYYAGLIS